MKRISRVLYGIDTGYEFGLAVLGKMSRVFGCKTNFYLKAHARRLAKKFSQKGFYQIKDIKFPLLDGELEIDFFNGIFDDTLGAYYYFDDRYDEETFSKCEKLFGEGVYGLVNDEVNVTVESGDVVIDAGSWIGDFAAYSAIKGGVTFAFEPSKYRFEYLLKTAKLNGNIHPIPKGLSNKTTQHNVFLNKYGQLISAEKQTVTNIRSEDKISIQNNDLVDTITLDDFVKEQKLERVDFIKSDIEGFERYMLQGAQETLKNFAPKLALCTYHLLDDPEVMSDLIMKANPRYKIVHGNMKLYASVK